MLLVIRGGKYVILLSLLKLFIYLGTKHRLNEHQDRGVVHEATIDRTRTQFGVLKQTGRAMYATVDQICNFFPYPPMSRIPY